MAGNEVMDMRRSVIIWTLLLWLVYGLGTFAAVVADADWTPTAEKLLRSVVLVELSAGDARAGSCTGWVIDNNRNYIATANHCDGGKDKVLTADGEPAKVIYKDVKTDLLVIQVDDIDRPALKLAKDNPAIGEEVASLGYGYALDRPMFRVAHVSDNKAFIPEGGIGGPFILLDATFVPGMSGGPVVNAAGEVVMIVQMGSQTVGIGRGAEEIRKKIGRYTTRTQ